jgi:hypothetical protein
VEPQAPEATEDVSAIGRDYRYSDEAREALFGAISRMADEYRFGRIELRAEDLHDLAGAWSYLNGGSSAREVMLDAELDRLKAEHRRRRDRSATGSPRGGEPNP